MVRKDKLGDNMRDIIQLTIIEFKKNFSWLKFVLIVFVLILASYGIIFFEKEQYKQFSDYTNKTYFQPEQFERIVQNREKEYQENPSVTTEYLLQNAKLELNTVEKVLEYSPDFHESWTNRYLINLLSSVSKASDIEIFLENPNIEVDTLQQIYGNQTKEELQKDLLIEQKKIEYYWKILKEAKRYDEALAIDLLLNKEEQNNLEEKLAELEKEKIEDVTEESVQQKQKIIDLKEKIATLQAQIKGKEFIVKNKISSSNEWHFDVLNTLFSFAGNTVEEQFTKEEYQLLDSQHLSYEEYQKTRQEARIKAEKETALSLYALEHNQKPTYNENTQKFDSKMAMDKVYYLGVIVVVFVCCLGGGIIAKEQQSGSIRLLFTKPISRSKILISKFLYLTTLLIGFYLLAYLIHYIMITIFGNYHDLLYSQLNYISGQVIEQNYLWYVLKNIVFHSGILLFIVAIVFFLSAFTANSIISVVGGLFTILGCFILIDRVSFLDIPSFSSFLPIYYVAFPNLLQNPLAEVTGFYPYLGFIGGIVFVLFLVILTLVVYQSRDITN